MNEEQYRAAIEKDPVNADLYYELACLIFEEKKDINFNNQAIDEVKKAIRIEPDNGLYHFKLGLLHKAYGNTGHDVIEFKICIHLKYNIIECEKLIAEGETKYDEQEDNLFNQTLARLEKNPDSARCLASMGHQYHYFKDDLDMALEYYLKAYKIDPKESECLIGLGRIYGELGKVEEAVNYFEQYIATNEDRDKKYEQGYGEIAKVYEDNKQYENALVWWRKAIELDPEDAYNYSAIGEIYVKMFEYGKAMAAFEECIRLKPGEQHGIPYHYLISYHEQFGDSKRSLYFIDEAIKNNPDSGYFLYMKGVYYGLRGDEDEAMKWYELSLVWNPSHPHTYNNMAAIYKNKGDTETALKYLLKGLEEKPDTLILHENLQKIYSELGDLEKKDYHTLKIHEIQIKELLKN